MNRGSLPRRPASCKSYLNTHLNTEQMLWKTTWELEAETHAAERKPKRRPWIKCRANICSACYHTVCPQWGWDKLSAEYTSLSLFRLDPELLQEVAEACDLSAQTATAIVTDTGMPQPMYNSVLQHQVRQQMSLTINDNFICPCQSWQMKHVWDTT